MRSLALLSGVTAMLMASAWAEPLRTAAVKARAYASPQEVYDAAREAEARQDLRTMFLCLTPEAQEVTVFESLFACGTTRHVEKAEAIRKRHGVDDAALNAEYDKRFYKKHGITAAEYQARYDEKARAANAGALDPSEIPPPNDEALVRQVVSDLVTDKPGFCEAVSKLLGRSDQPGPGRLESLQIQGDAAIGRKSQTSYHLQNVGRGMEKVWTTQLVTIRFRKVHGSWLIDTPQ
jgi:hypothetical protein